jgi:phosphoribosylaminoimidazole-succinocarboxamide synthase
MTIPATPAVLETRLHSLPLLARGKVRDVYAVGDDRLLMIATDRLSAFDVVMREPVPGKGALLTQTALFWFERLAHIVPNHLTGEDPLSVVQPDEVEQVRGRSMLVRRLAPVPAEAVVRGYLAGSGWKEYQASRSVCGLPLPEGLQKGDRLPEPIFTPATKAAVGDHDENISFAMLCERIGTPLATQLRGISIRLYQEASAYALGRGLILADTKFEFGHAPDGTLMLMDEVLTSDSSRYWQPTMGEAEGTKVMKNFDKQSVRDWLEAPQPDGSVWNKKPPAPALPAAVIEDTVERYAELLRILKG